ncbi:hypothetical protein FE407_04565 [Leuconostoc carnosum]|uniref:TenA family protein n=1 Tax=Leuconostoc TaxID=1243 RepID=UPI000D5207F6|nr:MULTISPECIES: TenA family protein [Leuconostoc]KAA8325315.1 hypothetical protein FE404_04085 [Leuconostoc carnosum]KAA8359539.1 hypothetical protein FE407_04565 [Leuconostoc carnosum]KAA8365113.1 hypothetical protein FE406_04565 [Leuconostoc carnosum]KAA8367483.1 hypothetical protein FE416_04810 [Leuconostoc carnosum]KAA8372676.1 hypothetical protein FE415_04825 [Leuconostoc carnosum]
MKFSELAHEKTKTLWQSSKEHPFIKGIETGELPLSAFKAYLLQDNFYVQNYLAIYNKILSTTKDNQIIEELNSGILTINDYDVEQQRNIYQLLSITKQDIQKTTILPTTYHYICHMHHAFNEYNEIHALSALLPCPWLYLEIFEDMLERKDYLQGKEQIYIDFVESYADPDFKNYVHKMIDLLDDLVERRPKEIKIDVLLQQFLFSSAEELRFWQMTLLPEEWDKYAVVQSKLS